MKVKIRNKKKDYRTVWFSKGRVWMLDQPKLPFKFQIAKFKNYKATTNAIKTMIVRGAPAIGATAAYATAQAVLAFKGSDLNEFNKYMGTAAAHIKKARPTAVDLEHAVDRVVKSLRICDQVKECKVVAEQEAEAIAQEYIAVCKKIGENGNKLIDDNSRILTHCNAGWLATVDWGTALAPIYYAKRFGKKVFVFVDETRPRMQGARLTAWELAQEGIEHAVIADNSAGYYMQQGEIDLCIVGADRIAANGDVANKIGTYEKAVLAKENGIPFYVAAPRMTFDFKCPSGDQIPIEERSGEEVTKIFSEKGIVQVANPSSPARNPAFDVTPAKYIKGYITEKGVLKKEELKKLL